VPDEPVVRGLNVARTQVATEPTSRQAFERRHCMVPASGYHEWIGAGKAKQSSCISPTHFPVRLLAGNWDLRASPEGGATPLSAPIRTSVPNCSGALAKKDRNSP
jgi:putative SOS response-associated peptidase YedK